MPEQSLKLQQLATLDHTCDSLQNFQHTFSMQGSIAVRLTIWSILSNWNVRWNYNYSVFSNISLHSNQHRHWGPGVGNIQYY